MKTPTVALVGKPNVGKSTIFNKLVGKKISIIEDTPGVTRDRIYGDVTYNNYKFHLIDTGGIELGNEDFNKEPDPPPQQVSVPGGASNNVKTEDFPKINCKKYVIYISQDNVDYVDNLSIDERTALINKVFEEKQKSDAKSEALKKRQRYYKHLMIVCLTVIISFPLLFFAVNKSLQITINNYQQSQQNFQKLYKEKGKIDSYQKFDIK